jgi:hypothetical protein
MATSPTAPTLADIKASLTATLLKAMAADVRIAADRLDSEEHRYVERYIPCPNGCEFDPAFDGRRTAGPDDCPLCFYGAVEDEDAAHMTPLIERLKVLADRLEAL